MPQDDESVEVRLDRVERTLRELLKGLQSLFPPGGQRTPQAIPQPALLRLEQLLKVLHHRLDR